MPFGIFLPQPVAGICGGLIILHQLVLVVSGNYSWLNWLTIVLAFLCLPDFGIGHSQFHHLSECQLVFMAAGRTADFCPLFKLPSGFEPGL